MARQAPIVFALRISRLAARCGAIRRRLRQLPLSRADPCRFAGERVTLIANVNSMGCDDPRRLRTGDRVMRHGVADDGSLSPVLLRATWNLSILGGVCRISAETRRDRRP